MGNVKRPGGKNRKPRKQTVRKPQKRIVKKRKPRKRTGKKRKYRKQIGGWNLLQKQLPPSPRSTYLKDIIKAI